MSLTINAIAVRTKMVGGGNSYDIYVPIDQKSYQPITGHCYATVIHWKNKKYYRVDDFLRTRKTDNLPALTSERFNAFRKLNKVAKKLEICLAKRAFPELKGKKRLPSFWTDDNFPSKDIKVRFSVNEKNAAKLELCQ